MKIKELESLKGSKLGLYDSNSKNRTSVIADKVIDVTEICPDAKRCIIKYAKVTRGLIAQICDWYESNEDFGLKIHYHINEMTPVELANDEVFSSHCMGAHPMELANVIFDNQPVYGTTIDLKI